MLAYQPIRSLATINMTIAYQGAAASKRILYCEIDKPIQIKNDVSATQP